MSLQYGAMGGKRMNVKRQERQRKTCSEMGNSLTLMFGRLRLEKECAGGRSDYCCQAAGEAAQPACWTTLVPHAPITTCNVRGRVPDTNAKGSGCDGYMVTHPALHQTQCTLIPSAPVANVNIPAPTGHSVAPGRPERHCHQILILKRDTEQAVAIS